MRTATSLHGTVDLYHRPQTTSSTTANDDHDDHDEDRDCLPLGNLSTKLHLCLADWLAPFLRLSTIPQWFREQWKFESGELVKRYVDFYFHRFYCAAAGRIRIPISAFTKSKWTTISSNVSSTRETMPLAEKNGARKRRKLGGKSPIRGKIDFVILRRIRYRDEHVTPISRRRVLSTSSFSRWLKFKNDESISYKRKNGR